MKMNVVKAKERELVTDGVGTDVVNGMAAGVGVFTALFIGIWGIACLVGGLVQAGGVLELAKSWLTAVTGV